MDAASRLCTACGLCCNGVLFEVVRLQSQDSIKHLTALGLDLKRRKREPYFSQPCAKLDGCTCTIYEDRPQRCRRFECRQIQQLQQQEISEATAAGIIAEAQRLVAQVEAQLPDAAPTALSLAERYRSAPAEEKLTGAKAMLDAYLQRHFLA